MYAKPISVDLALFPLLTLVWTERVTYLSKHLKLRHNSKRREARGQVAELQSSLPRVPCQAKAIEFRLDKQNRDIPRIKTLDSTEFGVLIIGFIHRLGLQVAAVRTYI